MVNRYKLFFNILFIALCLFLIGALLSNRFPLESSPRVSDLKYITEHHPEDQLFQELMQLDERIIESDVRFPENRENKEPCREDWQSMNDSLLLLQNGRILAEFYTLLRQKYLSDFSLPDRSARTALNQELTASEKVCYPGKLVHLLETQAELNGGEGDGQSVQAVEGLSAIARAFCQNPTMISLLGGMRILSIRNRILLNKHLLMPGDNFTALNPSREELRFSLLQAVWNEYRLMECLTLSSDLEGSMDTLAEQWGTRMLLNREQTVGYFFDDFRRFEQCLNSGLLEKRSELKRFNKRNPLHLILNPVGKLLVEVSSPYPYNIQKKLCVLLWQNHAAELLQVLWQNGETLSKQRADSICESLHLINPATGKGYDTDETGHLILMKNSAEMALFKPDELEELSGFPVILPLLSHNSR
jgi:hypothetical protein